MTQPLPAAITTSSAPDNNVRVGTVTQVAPLIVNVQGGGVVSPGILFGATYAVGQTVALIRQDQSWLVMGPIAAGDLSPVTGPVSFAGAIGGDSTASASFSELGSVRSTFIKRFEGTKLRFDLSVSCFTTAVNTAVEFGLQALVSTSGAGLVATGPAMLINTANEHTMMSSFAFLSGVSAGPFEVRPLWRRTAGAGTLTTDANDWVSYAVQEVF